jgi:hypothetical protein
MAEPKKPRIPLHPLLENAAQLGQTPESAVRFAGYVGPASKEGHVRLYSSLEDLSHYLEFEENCVLHTDKATDNIAPNNGLFIWVKASCPIRWTCEYKNARNLAAKIAKMGPAGVVQNPGIY